mmetsp:Transcript_142677/g.265965  ORF Transcript_142677/g.265965 Transcript_142677/m.265965 type:complete len:485 (+) Transcript_142677:64-1518(+)
MVRNSVSTMLVSRPLAFGALAGVIIYYSAEKRKLLKSVLAALTASVAKALTPNLLRSVIGVPHCSAQARASPVEADPEMLDAKVAKIRAAPTLDPAFGDTSTAAASTDAGSESHTSPPSPHGACNLLLCPWHDAISYFLTSSDLGRVSLGSTAFRTELTVEAKHGGESGRRLLVVPVVELQIETAEAELRRVSLVHIHILRIWKRLSLNAAAAAVAREGPQSGLRNLDKFVLKGCPLNEYDVNDLLVPMLAATPALKLLNLEKNQLVDAPIIRLAASGLLQRVETLNLRFNKIGDKGAQALASSPGLAYLRWINLKMNCVSDNGAIALATALHNNRSMTLLNLRKQVAPGGVGLSDRSAFAFAEMLKENSTLQQLRLRRNKITDAGASALAAAAAERMPRLCRELPPSDLRLELDLEENRIGKKGALALLRASAAIPRYVRLEILLHENPAKRDSLALAVVEAGEALDATDQRLSFDTKGEFEL